MAARNNGGIRLTGVAGRFRCGIGWTAANESISSATRSGCLICGLWPQSGSTTSLCAGDVVEQGIGRPDRGRASHCSQISRIGWVMAAGRTTACSSRSSAQVIPQPCRVRHPRPMGRIATDHSRSACPWDSKPRTAVAHTAGRAKPAPAAARTPEDAVGQRVECRQEHEPPAIPESGRADRDHSAEGQIVALGGTQGGEAAQRIAHQDAVVRAWSAMNAASSRPSH